MRVDLAPRYEHMGQLLLDVLDGLRPDERLSVAEAAEKYRFLNNPGSYVGPFRNAKAPYNVEVMDTLDSRDHKACIFVAPAQSAKTEIILNWASHTIKCAPADFIIYQTSQSVARDFSKRRIDRMMRHSPIIGSQLLQRGDSDNVFDKHFRSGMMLTLSWPTINELSGRPVGKVALTDYDRMPEDVDKEGSPFDLGQKRTTTFGSFAMTFAESSPGFETTNPKWLPATKHEAPPCPGILALYNRGDRRRWYWPCPHCGEYFEASFKDLDWCGHSEPSIAAKHVRLVCPLNGCLITSDHKYMMNLAGVWLREGQTIDANGIISGEGVTSNVASFWLKGPAAAFTSWEDLVVKYLQAEAEFQRTGSQEALKATVNTDQGEPYAPRTSGSDRLPEDLKSRAEVLPEKAVPPGVRCLLATIDVQANCWVVQVHGIIPGNLLGTYDVVVVDRFMIQKSKRRDADGDAQWVKPGTYLEDWDLVTEQVLERTYPLADGSGRHMQIKMTACDSGGKKGVTAKAYDYYRTLKKKRLHKRFRLVKGTGQPNSPRVNLSYPDSGRKDRTANARGEIPVLLLNTDKLKDQLDKMLDRKEPGGGMIRFAESLPDSFFVELTVEQKDVKGRWVNPKQLRNEAWDLLVYLLGLISDPDLRIDQMDWSKPLIWVAPWETNSLVFDAVKGEKRFEAVPKEMKSFSEMAQQLS